MDPLRHVLVATDFGAFDAQSGGRELAETLVSSGLLDQVAATDQWAVEMGQSPP